MTTCAILAYEIVDGDEQQNNIYTTSSGQILTSNGVDTLPSFQSIPGLITYNAVVTSGSAVSLTSTTPVNITSLSLPSGSYMISGIAVLSGAITVLGSQIASISTTSATSGTLGNNAVSCAFLTASFLLGDVSISVPSYPITLSSTSTVYLVAQTAFSLGSLKAYGRITAAKLS